MIDYLPRVLGTVGHQDLIRAVVGWQSGELIKVRPLHRGQGSHIDAVFYGQVVVFRMWRIYFKQELRPADSWADYYLRGVGWVS